MPERSATILLLIQRNDKSPVEEWLNGVKDKATRAKIERQIEKLAYGQGFQKRVGTVNELKIDLGPGYRIYYAFLDNDTCIVLVYAGDKSDQKRDIKSATQLWNDFDKSGRSDVALRQWREPPQIVEEKEAEDE